MRADFTGQMRFLFICTSCHVCLSTSSPLVPLLHWGGREGDLTAICNRLWIVECWVSHLSRDRCHVSDPVGSCKELQEAGIYAKSAHCASSRPHRRSDAMPQRQERRLVAYRSGDACNGAV